MFCLQGYMQTACMQGSKEGQRKLYFLELDSQMLWAEMWVGGVEHWSFAGVVSGLNFLSIIFCSDSRVTFKADTEN